MKGIEIRIGMPGFLVMGAVAISLFASAALAEDPYPVSWSSQLGTSFADYSYSVAADTSGNTFISGYTDGSLGGSNAGGFDAFLAKYDPNGNLLWTEQLGTVTTDWSYSVAVDGTGNAFISGFTDGNLDGTSAGGFDAFLAKYDPNGNLLWTEQLGTSDSDYSYSVATDASGNAFITGFTFGSLAATNAGGWDAFLAKYDPNGILLWTEQLATSADDFSYSVAVDASGSAFITGGTGGSLGGTNAGSRDAFLARYDPNGTLLWIEQLGTSGFDNSRSVALDDSGNVYISGETFGSLSGTNAGSSDAFLAKYDPNGTLLWIEQLGTSDYDTSHCVAVDASGSAFISGRTDGSLSGANAGDFDAYLTKYDPAGNLLWTEQLGTALADYSLAVAVDPAGHPFISGYTSGSLAGTNVGGYDAFLIKFTPLPCGYVVVGDLDDNCRVNLADFALLADLADFTAIATNWLIDCNVDPVNPACVPIP